MLGRNRVCVGGGEEGITVLPSVSKVVPGRGCKTSFCGPSYRARASITPLNPTPTKKLTGTTSNPIRATLYSHFITNRAILWVRQSAGINGGRTNTVLALTNVFTPEFFPYRATSCVSRHSPATWSSPPTPFQAETLTVPAVLLPFPALELLPPPPPSFPCPTKNDRSRETRCGHNSSIFLGNIWKCG